MAPARCWPLHCKHEVAAYVAQFADQLDENGHRLVVRNALQLEMFETEQRELQRLRSEEELPDSAVRPLLAELDKRIAAVRSTGIA